MTYISPQQLATMARRLEPASEEIIKLEGTAYTPPGEPVTVPAVIVSQGDFEITITRAGFIVESSEFPATIVRVERLDALIDYYRVEDPQVEHGIANRWVDRFAAVSTTSQEFTDSAVATFATFEDACSALADELVDSGRGPHGIYDLDTGERIELHITTPVVTRSEDQCNLKNPLHPEDD